MKKNILIITYWSFDNALIQTYTLPYVKQIKQFTNGGHIYLFTLSQNKNFSQAIKTQVEELQQQNIFLIAFNYKNFGISMLLKMLYLIGHLFFLCFRRKITTIHAWCTPGGAIGYVLSMLTGKPLVLDSFEPHAQTMVEGTTWKKSSLAYRLLFKFEKLQLNRAVEVICAAPGMIAHSQQLYGITKQRYFVKPACVDLELFSPSLEGLPSSLSLKKVVCVYAGKFGGIYLQQEVFDFFKTAHTYWKGDFSVLLLTSHSEEEIVAYCTNSGLPRDVVIKQFVPHSDVPKYMALGTFGICPVKPLPSKQFCTPIKNGEYWAMGLPVVITKNISVDSELIQQHNLGYVLNDLSGKEYESAVKKMNELMNDPQHKNRIRDLAIKERNFENALAIYKTIYG